MWQQTFHLMVAPDGESTNTEGQRAGRQGRGVLINMDYQTYSQEQFLPDHVKTECKTGTANGSN